MWINPEFNGPDTYAAFRGTFDLPAETALEAQLSAATFFMAWLDGQLFTEGPARFAADHPEYEATAVSLPKGRHTLSVIVHYEGLTTRISPDMPPFLSCRIFDGDKEVGVSWKCMQLPGFRPGVRRIGGILGWIECCDTAKNPAGWQDPAFNDSEWTEPDPAVNPAAALERCINRPVRQIVRRIRHIAEGFAADMYGYEMDDIPTRFFLRDLRCEKVPPQGVWRRYDLGFVRVGRARFTLDLPAGAVVEIAGCEELAHGRVSPHISLMTSLSCNMDRYYARGGIQEFMPVTPKGGRFLEIHIMAHPDEVRFIGEEFIERSYHEAPEGSFNCNDELLNRIWKMGAETFRSCAEDAITDCPVRERGQWTGDTVIVGFNSESVLYSDTGLSRRCLIQAAQCALPGGMIPGLFPGNLVKFTTYALQWVNACVAYYRATGDVKLLEDLYPAAMDNMNWFIRNTGENGLMKSAGNVFIDWGYKPDGSGMDAANNLFYLKALRAMTEWSRIIGKHDGNGQIIEYEKKITALISDYLADAVTSGDWQRIGYHTAVLALSEDLFNDGVARSQCLAYIKAHILNCFPNNPLAPRLADPSVRSRQLITPYFAHFAFPVLMRNGEAEFVHSQYRKCWGWMLKQGCTTALEVFDIRWSHCHQWSSCPTWQLSRYALGLHPVYSGNEKIFRLDLKCGCLESAEGAIPLHGGTSFARISWKRDGDTVKYHVECDEPIVILHDNGKFVVKGVFECDIRL